MKQKKIKITFILPSLAAGGAERILSFIAQELNKDDFEPTLLVTGYEKETVYQLKDLNIIYLNKSRVLKSVFSLAKYFKKNKPNIVVSSIVHLNTLTALISIAFPKIKFVAREANVLTTLNKHNPYTKSFFPKFLVKIAYRLVDCIICQSKDMQKDMIDNYHVDKSKTILINNPITKVYPLKSDEFIKNNVFRFITVARLSKEKGHDRILEALSKLDFDFKYTIIGNGPEKEAIFNKIKSYQLENVIEYISFTNEVHTYLSENNLFLQGSYVEGFPNVLLESCVVGTPILAFNAPGGLDEIIEQNKNGLIAKNIDEYIMYLKALHSDFIFNPKTVSQIVKDRFKSQYIVSQYENLFKHLVA